MDPAVERITTVDERAKEQVRKAREYAEKVAVSRAGDGKAAADAEREAARLKIEAVIRAADEKTDRAVAEARAKADAEIDAIRRVEKERADAIASSIVTKITEGAL